MIAMCAAAVLARKWEGEAVAPAQRPYNMAGNAHNFYLATVKPTVDEFLATCMDIRRGRLASIVLFHMADYLTLERGVEPGKGDP